MFECKMKIEDDALYLVHELWGAGEEVLPIITKEMFIECYAKWILAPKAKMIDEMPYPLCIIEDRYTGAYSGALFLAFNMYPEDVAKLNVDGDDVACSTFWDCEAKDFIIGKGDTPNQALKDLREKLGKTDV